MNVLVLGGTGRIGAPVARILAASELVEHVSIAGRDVALAERTASEIGPKAIAVGLDVLDEQRLTASARGVDLVVNTAGPDFLTALPAARAAIAAGAHCCDISADGPTTEVIASAPWRRASSFVPALPKSKPSS